MVATIGVTLIEAVAAVTDIIRIRAGIMLVDMVHHIRAGTTRIVGRMTIIHITGSRV